MADDEPSLDRLERLKAAIADLVVAQLHSFVILASMVAKLDVILLKLHISVTSQPSPSFPSVKSPSTDNYMDSTITAPMAQHHTETIPSMSPKKKLTTPLAPMSSQPVSVPKL